MAEAQQKTCRKRRTSKDRMTAERTTAKNKARRQKRHLWRMKAKRKHMQMWAQRNHVKGTDLQLSAKDLRMLVFVLRNDRVFAEQYRAQ